MEGDEGECRSVLDHSFTSSALEEASRSRRMDEVEGGGWTRSKNFLGKMLSTSRFFQVVSVRVRESAYYGGSKCALARFQNFHH